MRKRRHSCLQCSAHLQPLFPESHCQPSSSWAGRALGLELDRPQGATTLEDPILRGGSQLGPLLDGSDSGAGSPSRYPLLPLTQAVQQQACGGDPTASWLPTTPAAPHRTEVTSMSTGPLPSPQDLPTPPIPSLDPSTPTNILQVGPLSLPWDPDTAQGSLAVMDRPVSRPWRATPGPPGVTSVSRAVSPAPYPTCTLPHLPRVGRATSGAG